MCSVDFKYSVIMKVVAIVQGEHKQHNEYEERQSKVNDDWKK